MTGRFHRLVITIGAFGLGRFVGATSTLILAAVAGPAAWGAHSTVRAGVDLGSSAARGGGELLGFRDLASGDGTLNQEGASAVVRAAFLLALAAALLTAPYFALTGLLWTHPWQVALTSLSVPPLVASQVITSALAAAGSTRTVFLEQLLGPLLRILIFALLLGFFHDAGPALALSLLIMSAIVFARTWKEAEKVAGARLRLLSFRADDLRQIRLLLSLGINVMLSGLMSRLDVLIVGSVLGLASAGVYAVLMAGTAMITISVGAVGRIAGPEIRLALANDQHEQLSVELSRWTRVGLTAALLLATAVQGFLTVAMPLMGYGWSVDTAIAAAIVAAAFVVWGGYGVQGFVLSLGGAQNAERRLLFVYAGLFAAASPFALLLFGLPGIASVSLICAVVLSFLRTREVRRRIAKSVEARGGASWLRPALAIGVALAPGPLLTLLVPDAPWIRLALLAAAGAATACLSLTIVLTPEDRALAISLIRSDKAAGS